MNTITVNKSAIASDVWFTDVKMNVLLDDGREIAIPIDWFPRLRDATVKQRGNWRMIGGGEGIHWDEIDEDILIAHLL